MGTRGPVPKRTDQRRRVNKPEIPLTEAVAGAVSSQPPGEPNWHPLAAEWYRSLADSGQSRFYEPSDWATARLIAESMSRDLNHLMVIPPSSLSAWLKAMTALLVTEGDRRRLSLELKRAESSPEVVDGVADLDEYRRRLSG